MHLTGIGGFAHAGGMDDDGEVFEGQQEEARGTCKSRGAKGLARRSLMTVIEDANRTCI